MRNLLIYSSILLLIVSCNKENDNNCNQDFIIAGDSLSNCYEIIRIDTVFYYSFKLDVNNDDSIDLKFRSYRNVASHGITVKTGCYLEIENPLLELSVEKESVSLFHEYISLKNLMDTIGENEKWLDHENGSIDISYLDIINHENPTSWTEYKDSINENIRQKYIGIRINEASFTNYYWIKLSLNNYTRVHIEELGRQKR